MIKFMPHQVIAEFPAGIGVNTLIGGPIKHLLAHICDKLNILEQAFTSQNMPAISLVIASLLIILKASKTFWRKIAAPLLTLRFGRATHATFRFESVATIGAVFRRL
jgi:MFS superfamily sulfate permease-like transporter